MEHDINDTVNRFLETMNDHRVNLGSLLPFASSADACECLRTAFNRFISTLNPDEEVGMVLASFASERLILVRLVCPLGPNLVEISGIEDNRTVSLVQHVSQLSFLLVPQKLAAEQRERPKIGFGSG